jgi:hypothetical protein
MPAAPSPIIFFFFFDSLNKQNKEKMAGKVTALFC